ncbi:MAG: hypothetical protein AAGI17_06350 [Planctomycetota bacterium]
MKKSVLVAMAMSAGTVVAQPTITLTVQPVVECQIYDVTVSISGVDFDPFAALTGLPAPAPTAYQIDVNISRDFTLVGDPAADQVRNIDVDGIFGPQPPASFFTATQLDSNTVQASNAALVFEQVDSAGGLFDDGALFTFRVDFGAPVFGDVLFSIGAPDPSAASFFGDVLDYGTDGTVPGSTPGGPGNALLGTALLRLKPAPGVVGAFGVFGLAATRRRR